VAVDRSGRPGADDPSRGAGTPRVDPGLCGRCVHARCTESARGSQFWQCTRAARDPGFARYPRLPVLACAGFVAAPESTP
jgi:hypothetical protein